MLFGRTGLRLDTTSERLHSISRETGQLIGALSSDRPVFIQAFISPEVPESHVQTRTNLLDMLRELDALGGSTIQVRIEDTEPFTEVAREAREKFGIVPREVPVLESARAGLATVFMGLAITCGAEEQVIPFMDRGLSSEYELAPQHPCRGWNRAQEDRGPGHSDPPSSAVSISKLFKARLPGQSWLSSKSNTRWFR